MYSIRKRSGSVGRDSSSSYRPSYTPRSTESSSVGSRYSRASSCDPFASSRPPPHSMSHSYHSDYSRNSGSMTSSVSNRYGSTGNLSSVTPYRSPYTPSSSSSTSTYRNSETPSYRMPDSSSGYGGYRSSADNYRSSSTSTYRASSTFTPRFESRLPPRDYSSSSLSKSTSLAKYRPEPTPSYTRPSYSSGSSSATSSYYSRPHVEFRSKTPAASEPTNRPSRFDRDYKSMTRFEKEKTEDLKSDDEVENTFQKLYNRYVKDVEEEEKPARKVSGTTERKFKSHSEAEEEATSEEEESASECEDSFAEALRRRREAQTVAASITPKGPSPSLVTPTASPLPQKKIINIPKEEPKSSISAAEEFRLKHSDVQMTPAVIEPRVLKPAASAMANLIKIDNFTSKVAEAITKKKTEVEHSSIIPAVPKASITVTPMGAQQSGQKAASSSTKTTVEPIVKKESSVGPKTGTIATAKASTTVKAPTPTDIKSVAQNGTDPKLPEKNAAPIITKVSTTETAKNASLSQKSTTSPLSDSLTSTTPASVKEVPNSNLLSPAPSETSKLNPSAGTSPSKSTSPVLQTVAQKTPDVVNVLKDPPTTSEITKLSTKSPSPVTTSIRLKSSQINTASSKSASPVPQPKTASTVITKPPSPAPEETKKDVEASTSPAPTKISNPSTASSTAAAPKSVSTRTRSPSPARKSSKTSSAPASAKTTTRSQSPSRNQANSVQKEASPKPPIAPTAAVSKTINSLLPPGGKARSTSPRPKPALTIDTKKAEEASTSVTIMIPQGTKSRSSSPSEGMRRSESPVPSGLTVPDRADRAQSATDGVENKKKTRDRNRTLENMLKEVAEKQKDSGEESPLVRPPILLITQASVPSTPKIPSSPQDEWGSGSGSYYGEGEDELDEDEYEEDEEEEGWTEAEDEQEFDSDYEFCISQTFQIPSKTPVHVYPPSSRGSPFVSDYDSDCSASFLASQKWEDSRGRVDRLFAVPPPTFTCSVSYDGQEIWDSDSVHSCEEDEDEYDDDLHWRPNSSSLGAYLSPAPFSSDDELDGSKYKDSVQVGFTLKLVDKAALKGSDESDSEYYDDEEYSDEDEYWDEEEEYDEEEEEEYTEEDEEYTEEEVEEEVTDEDEEEYMHSAEERSPSPVMFTASIAEEQFSYEETDDALFDADFELALPMAIPSVESTAQKHREITYTKDLEMHMAVESAEMLTEEEKEAAKAVAKRIKKDGTTESASRNLVPQMVAPVQESVALMEAEEVDGETLEILNPMEVPEITGVSDVNVIPTFVRPQTERVEEEYANRLAAQKPSTDFARKAVIQPAKLEKALVKQTVTTEAPVKPSSAPKIEEVKKSVEPIKPVSSKVDVKPEVAQQPGKQTTAATTTKVEEKKTEISKQSVPPASKITAPVPHPAKEVEDKSSVRKSALNMREEEAKKKAAADEEAARQKARRLGTVSALADKFKEKPKEEPITYKRSSLLAKKDAEETTRPRRKYEIVKPVLNDEFDKQMEEIRAQMKAGSSQFQSDLKDFSKGIKSTTDEVKKKELEEKHKKFLDKTSGVFGVAEEEKQRWKERRDGKEKPEKVKAQAVEAPKEEPKKEPKRTIRRINRDKTLAQPQMAEESTKQPIGKQPTVPPPGPSVPTQAGTPAKKSVPPIAPVAPPPPKEPTTDRFRRERTPVVNPADTLKKPMAPKQDLVIDDNNAALLEAVTKVATRRRKSLINLQQEKDQNKVDPKKEGETPVETKTVLGKKTEAKQEPKVPKSEGAAATKIRNALSNATNAVSPGSKSPTEGRAPPKRYGTRRKTQEIVNESLQQKKRRKEVPRHGKFIGDPHDIDILLGWDKENSFEMMEMMLEKAAKDRRPLETKSRKRRIPRGKIWISDLTDIDKIYKASEMRDIAASVDEN